CMFITHDMGVVAEIADKVMVMRYGEVVEQGDKRQVLLSPQKEYTQQLLAAVPSMVPPEARQWIDPQAPVVVRAQGLEKTYTTASLFGTRRKIMALQPADLHIHAGETLGIVGESGSGKSTLARCLIRLIEPTGGKIYWDEHEISGYSESKLRPLRNKIQVVFQDPNRSLNPRRTVVQSLTEGAINFGLSYQEAYHWICQLMEQVQLPVDSLHRYPNQFSGGQRQRLAIARALACRPKLLIADEAVSALDVSVQAQILELLRSFKAKLGLGMLFITHDLRVAAQLCDRVIVMQNGHIVEQGPTQELYKNPQQPYTQHLFHSAPKGIQAL
ncbi:MAG: ATP-binding cassette domain-containing protein, partial [Gammaproteobacteria bacterium]|nr:ATP-binding cassette domain-containing protein [Gammaproteobacteria bacterium]